ncbi:MFS transporter [Domibacillus iocasae]|uniref:Multidrug MFS transporter n=1 Tax=Domibacillus iocasae TaxID=1714016 RepID=A0A1E7DNY4_9BACI|nr:MFS transporter [Domibacillus iocasae]OES44759.1 multidrug MFS transporter [Domibacillus iocasae]
MHDQSIWSKDFILVSISSFFQFMTFYTMLATLPMFVLDFLQGTSLQAGLVITLHALGAILLRPLTGRWLDELGRERVLQVSLILFTGICFLYLGVRSLLLLLFIRLFHGMTFGTLSTTMATIAIDISPDQRKGEALGYFGMFMSLAMVLGPFTGLAIISHYSYNVLFICCTVFALLTFLSGSLAGAFEKKEKAKSMESLSWRNFIEIKAVPYGLMTFILAFVYAGTAAFIPIYARQIGMESFAGYFFVIFAAFIILSRLFVGKLYDRKGTNMVVYPFVLVYIIGMITLSQAHNPLFFLSAGALVGLGYGALHPSFQTLAVQSVANYRRGLATSTFYLFFDLGVAVGSFLLGIISSHTNYSFIYILCAVFLLLIYALYYYFHQQKNSPDTI